MTKIDANAINEALSGSRYNFPVLSLERVNKTLEGSRYNFRTLNVSTDESQVVVEPTFTEVLGPWLAAEPEEVHVNDLADVEPGTTEIDAEDNVRPIIDTGAERHKKRNTWKFLGAAACAVLAVFVGVRTLDGPVSKFTSSPATAAETPNPGTVEIGKLPIEVTIPEDAASTEVPTTTITPVTATVSTASKEAPATTEIPATTEAPTTTEAAPVLSLSQLIASGQVKIGDHKGEALGVLSLDKYCDENVQIYIGNPIDLSTPEAITANMPALSPEAQISAQYLLDHPNLGSTERRTIEDDIRQGGGSPDYYRGDPMYSAIPVTEADPATALDPNCVPEAVNPRVKQKAYGSTEVNAAGVAGAKADQYQAVGDLMEYGQLPEVEGSSYMEFHRSSQNAAGSGLNQKLSNGYELGDTVTYTVDGNSTQFVLVDIAKIGVNDSVPTFIQMLDSVGGSKKLAIQVCIDQVDTDRAVYIFERI